MATIAAQQPSAKKTKIEYTRLVINRRLFENLFVFLFQFTGLNLTTFNSHISPIWFASGTACAFIFLRGYTVLPGIWIGTLCALYFAGFKTITAINFATLYSVQAYLLLWVSHRYITPTLLFYGSQKLLRFIGFCSILTGIISLFLAYTCYGPKTPMSICIQWWLANLNGALIFSFALITWDAYFPQIEKFNQLNKTILVLFFSILVIFISFILINTHLINLTYSSIALCTWTLIISLYYGWCGAVTTLFLTGFMIGIASYMGALIFEQPNLLFLIQITLFLQTGLSTCISSRHLSPR